ncbi:hypothetical protein ATK17_3570 [Branchiibius hedensis]|uniref:DUF559 domain-containing protein n=1 Tax=Branchiibius hedensis TaxID=672460 RepID=A0A2Y8ZXC7_9MICO|nr:hypothetical protein [Branchiibius hedensis]PWJ27375.1 hypothetical protein ATK17_3570 [Branchiibius hedensis]SSA36186.1 hypothetical protein SAMN04489750_3570 [Branchiibius hedensis]
MPVATPIPAVLRGRPFSTAEAAQVGVSRTMLRGARFESLHNGRGVWAVRDRGPRDLTFWLAADRLALPRDAAVSYQTGLKLHGAPIDDNLRHWTTTQPVRVEMKGAVLHRRQMEAVCDIDDLPVLLPLRCLLDAALIVSPLTLIRAGDALLATKKITLADLQGLNSAYGVQRLRTWSRWMRRGVESPRESSTRVIFALGGLPEPVLNLPVYDSDGCFIGRPDFLWQKFGVTAEYDGWYHERDAKQRHADILRSEKFARAGLFRVALTAADHAQPRQLVWRVWQALADHGYDGPPPQFDMQQWWQMQRRPRR